MNTYRPGFYILICLLIVGGFIFLPPKIVPRLIKKQADTTLSAFIENSKRNHKIDPVEFWKFREFYSPGTYDFRKKGFEGKEPSYIVDNFKVASTEGSFFPFLYYRSEKTESVEALVDDPTLVASISASMKNENCDLHEKREIICKQNGIFSIYFVKTIDEMKKANAFYDYRDTNTDKLIKGKYWFAAVFVKSD